MQDPVFKSVMFALLVIYIALVSQSVFAAESGNTVPHPVMSSDIICSGLISRAAVIINAN